MLAKEWEKALDQQMSFGKCTKWLLGNDVYQYERFLDSGEKIIVKYQRKNWDDLWKFNGIVNSFRNPEVMNVEISRVDANGNVINEASMSPEEFAVKYFDAKGDDYLLTDKIVKFGLPDDGGTSIQQQDGTQNGFGGAQLGGGQTNGTGSGRADVLLSDTSANSYNNFDDFKNAASSSGYSIEGLSIPENAKVYKIHDGQVTIVKDDNTIATIPLQIVSNSYITASNSYITGGIGDTTIDLTALITELTDMDVSTDDMKKVRNTAVELLNYFEDNVLKISMDIITIFPEINKLTAEKLMALNLNIDNLINIYKTYQNATSYLLNDVISSMKAVLEKYNTTNKGDEQAATTRPIRTINSGSNNGGPSGDSSTDTSTVDETVVIDQETLTRLMPAVTGLVTFTEIVSMYEKIGNNLPIQSSEAGQYGLIGVVQENGKYYYKLLDTKTGKVYFTEITEKSKIKWDEKGERKVVEVVDENAMILKQAGESDNGLVRIADKGDVYLLTDDNTTVDGIDYYNIMDSKTDNKAYLVSSDSVSQPKSISDLISAVEDSEVTKND